jgi:oligopeptide/dipeptide ABC transporter ATP-binding protein
VIVDTAVFRLEGVTKRYGDFVALDDATLEVGENEYLSFLGPSGSGKTTLLRVIAGFEAPEKGRVHFEGRDITNVPAHERGIGFVFQNFNLLQVLTAYENVEYPLLLNGVPAALRRSRVTTLLESVGLADRANNRPGQLSGGQRQRIGIARALAVDPDFVVADEPVSALDVSIQAQVINLLDDLKDQFNLTMLFIAHDLAVVEHICDRVIVMYLGRIMEIAPAQTLYSTPNHPYTQALLSAVPIPQPGRKRARVVLKGDIPSPINPPSGCVFRTRCPRAVADCATTVPALKQVGPDHVSACILTT